MQQHDRVDSSSASSETQTGPSRRRRVLAAMLIGALVLSSLVWGGVSAMQAAAAQEQREAQRVAALAALLDDRSTSAELLAVSGAVLGVVELDAAQNLDLVERLASERGRLEDELDRPLDRDTELSRIVAQHRLLEGARSGLMEMLDDTARATITEARAALDASPLADERRKAELNEAINALAVVRQGQSSSYSGRAELVEAALTVAATVRESHAEEKAEQERREAERRAAEEAARRASNSGGGPSSSLEDAIRAYDQVMIDRGCTRLSATRWRCPTDVDWNG